MSAKLTIWTLKENPFLGSPTGSGLYLVIFVDDEDAEDTPEKYIKLIRSTTLRNTCSTN
jgi:hypothetical protein